jgi:hypothetical protein
MFLYIENRVKSNIIQTFIYDRRFGDRYILMFKLVNQE